MITATLETKVSKGIAVKKLRNIPEGYFQCTTPTCRQLAPQEQARNYGAGNVCPTCYDKWLETED